MMTERPPMNVRPAVVVGGLVALALLLGVRLWLLESSPPTLQIAGVTPGGVVLPTAILAVHTEDEGLGIGELVALIDGELIVVSGGPTDWTIPLPARLPEGAHALVLLARDRSWNRNETRERLEFRTDGSPPRFRLAPSTQAAQGRVLPIALAADEFARQVEATAFGRPLALEQRGGLWLGLTGAGVSEEDGELVITAEDALGNRGERRIPLPVATTDFPDGGVVTLDARRQKNQQDEALRAEDRSKRQAAYAQPQPEWLVEGPGQAPCEGIVSSAFGKVRRYNTGVVRHHLGTDIAAGRGTPVRSSGAGVVALAEGLPIHGNAVIVRHGPSLSTSYNHLHTIDVEVGQAVGKGDVVGTVGSTGQSTGPHLHWGMVAGGVAVAAESWLEGDLLSPSAEDRAALEAPWPAP